MLEQKGELHPGQQTRTAGSFLIEKNLPAALVGGLTIPALTRQQTAQLIIEESRRRRDPELPCLFCSAVNGQVISLCASDIEVRALFDAADMINADGMSVVFASKLLAKTALPERVATTDLFHDVARLAEKSGSGFYFFGAEEVVNRRTIANVKQLYPDLKIVGRRHGFFSEDDEQEIIDAINAAAPDVLWIAMGAPREQAFIVRNRHKLTRVGAIQTSGGLFDFLSGKNSRAPLWMQQAGFEWAYRLMLEPKRLFMRYALTNPHAIAVMLTRTR